MAESKPILDSNESSENGNNESSGKKSAFLVIHGVGSHQPFDVLYSFVRGSHKEIGKKKWGAGIISHHRLQPRVDWSGTDMDWVQSYISLSFPSSKRTIDFYEYFWDNYMVHEVNSGQIIQWLVTASKGLRKILKMDIDETDLKKSPYFRKTKRPMRRIWEFAPAGYLKLLGGLLGAFSLLLPYLPGAVGLLESWAGKQVPVVGFVLKAMMRFVDKAVKSFCGDLVRYIVVEPRSEHYETRKRVLNGAVDELHELLDRYDEVIVAGHSLGSVIAYDALNRIILEVNSGRMEKEKAAKITGLVTFGSPLDKVVCFFVARIDDEKTLQRQVLANLHGFRFKTESLVPDKGNIDVEDPMVFKIPGARWLNFYHTSDLISGKLDLYDLRDASLANGDGNIRIKAEMSKVRAHSCYWGEHLGEGKGTNEMYEHIFWEFLP